MTSDLLERKLDVSWLVPAAFFLRSAFKNNKDLILKAIELAIDSGKIEFYRSVSQHQDDMQTISRFVEKMPSNEVFPLLLDDCSYENLEIITSCISKIGFKASLASLKNRTSKSGWDWDTLSSVLKESEAIVVKGSENEDFPLNQAFFYEKLERVSGKTLKMRNENSNPGNRE